MTALPDLFRVEAIFDTDADLLHRASKAWRLPTTTSLESLLESDLDAVLCCTPVEDHLATCVLALERGLGVLCEKPMVDSHAEAEVLRHAASSSGRELMVGLLRRHDPAVAALIGRLSEAGQVPLAVTVETRDPNRSRPVVYQQPTRLPAPSRLSLRRTLHSSVVHDLDLAWQALSACGLLAPPTTWRVRESVHSAQGGLTTVDWQAEDTAVSLSYRRTTVPEYCQVITVEFADSRLAVSLPPPYENLPESTLIEVGRSGSGYFRGCWSFLGPNAFVRQAQAFQGLMRGGPLSRSTVDDSMELLDCLEALWRSMLPTAEEIEAHG
ncbi:MAG: Gfo/Idh/MocA family oxidoreductase [Actinomycetota bacterium]|nr:Gfo/Idh/MocA family oxidoreductase [Actinomycetota bacterium]